VPVLCTLYVFCFGGKRNLSCTTEGIPGAGESYLTRKEIQSGLI